MGLQRRDLPKKEGENRETGTPFTVHIDDATYQKRKAAAMKLALQSPLTMDMDRSDPLLLSYTLAVDG